MILCKAKIYHSSSIRLLPKGPEVERGNWLNKRLFIDLSEMA